MTSQMAQMGEVIERLRGIIESRRAADPERSYVAKLLKKGPKKIAQKVGEEAVETALAAIGGDKGELVAESADLLFHMMVLWEATGIRPEDIAAELARREGLSGIEEKKSRNW